MKFIWNELLSLFVCVFVSVDLLVFVWILFWSLVNVTVVFFFGQNHLSGFFTTHTTCGRAHMRSQHSSNILLTHAHTYRYTYIHLHVHCRACCRVGAQVKVIFTSAWFTRSPQLSHFPRVRAIQNWFLIALFYDNQSFSIFHWLSLVCPRVDVTYFYCSNNFYIVF